VTCDVWHGRNNEYVEHKKVLAEEAGPVLGRHRLLVGWHGDKKELFANEERELTAYNLPGGTLIDFESRVTPVKGTMKVGGDPQHAGFHFRADNEVDKNKAQTVYVRPDGVGEAGKERNYPADKAMVNLPWNGMSFVLGEKRYTTAYLDHPANPKEARYSERTYGRFGSYFVAEATPDKPLVVRYRVWVQEGQMKPEQIAALDAAFVDPPQVTVEKKSAGDRVVPSFNGSHVYRSRNLKLPRPRRLPSMPVAPRKTKHISLVVCSPSETGWAGRNGLLGFLSELS